MTVKQMIEWLSACEPDAYVWHEGLVDSGKMVTIAVSYPRGHAKFDPEAVQGRVFIRHREA